MKLIKKEKEIILECLEGIWNCSNDEPFYENENNKELIRQNLLSKFRQSKGK